MRWLFFCFVTLVFACASPPPRSTRMTVGDFNDMAEQMAQSLLRSDAVANRSADSEPWIVAIDKVVNLTDDVMTTDEQWAVIAMLRGAMSMVQLRRTKNIRFIAPPGNGPSGLRSPGVVREDSMRDIRTTKTGQSPMAGFRWPDGQFPGVTHTVTAVFRSVLRAQRTRRSDLYYCEFEMLDLRDGEPVWIDKFEFKRSARGHLWD